MIKSYWWKKKPNNFTCWIWISDFRTRGVLYWKNDLYIVAFGYYMNVFNAVSIFRMHMKKYRVWVILQVSWPSFTYISFTWAYLSERKVESLESLWCVGNSYWDLSVLSEHFVMQIENHRIHMCTSIYLIFVYNQSI